MKLLPRVVAALAATALSIGIVSAAAPANARDTGWDISGARTAGDTGWD